MSRFEYVIKKIEAHQLKTKPFKHIYIDNFLKKKDYNELIKNIPLDKDWKLSTKKKSLRRRSWQSQTYSINHKKYKIINEFSKVIESKEFSVALFKCKSP